MAGPTRATTQWSGNSGSYPSYASDSTSKFIPEVWASQLVTKFYGTTVFAAVANTDHQGQIQGVGDNVVIRKRAPITIKDYKIGQELDVENPESTATNLPIDNAKYFNVAVDDVDAYQADINLMDTFTDEATEQMQQTIDTQILGDIYADVASDNEGATAGTISGNIDLGKAAAPVTVDASSVLKTIVNLSVVLGEQNVPRTGRWLIIPEWMAGLIMRSDLKDASLAGDSTSILRNGRLGQIGMFTLYVSNNLTTDDDGTHIIAGHSAGLTFASQITKVENIQNPKSFGQLVRGLNVFGYKVVEPKYLAHALVTA
jgi:hypothetical protein